MSTSKTETEQSNTPYNANESTNQHSLTNESERFGNTPIFLRWTDSHGHYATIGEYRFTEYYQLKSNLIEKLNNPDIMMIINVQWAQISKALIVYEETLNTPKEEKQN